MTEKSPADGQRQTLADRINGAVGGFLKREESLEELVHGVRRIRQTQMPQRIGLEQVAELVINVRNGRRMMP